jgi:HlyD family secretion protein
MPRKVRRLLPIIIIIAAAAFGGYRWWVGQAEAQPSGLGASGTIEATDVSISAETSGRVMAVPVDEGDSVKAGQTLVRLDDTLLQAQRRQAAASLAAAQGSQTAAEANQAAAQAQLDLARAGTRAEDLAVEQQTVAAAQGRVSSAQGQLDQARGALQAATAQREQAVAHFADVKQFARPEQIDASAVAYQQALAAMQVAQSNYDKVAGRPDVGSSPQALALQQATLAMNAAKANYQGLLAGATTPQLEQARAGVDQAVAGIVQAGAVVSQTEAALATARASLAAEQARLESMQAGNRPEQIRAAEAQLAAAKAQAQAASGQVAAAQASVALIDEQIARLNIVSPIDGVVLSRAVEPGEMALPGGTLLTLGDLGHLTLTVYLPETEYGAVSVQQEARVTVDSFPGQTFSGSVQHIANQAEFTPRNVQTPAGRQTTVFGVKLALANPQGLLKPGMPADVAFAKTGAAASAAK